MSGDQNAPGGGRGRNGLILTGHDHTGCDVMHFIDHPPMEEAGSSNPEDQNWFWDARRYISPPSSAKVTNTSQEASSTPQIREVTLRSMMGEYGGNAGLLSLWFDPDPSVQEWRYKISTCQLGVQHIWWGIHVLGIVTLVLCLVWGIVSVVEYTTRRQNRGGYRSQSTLQDQGSVRNKNECNGGKQNKTGTRKYRRKDRRR
jgi:hypothetical protein